MSFIELFSCPLEEFFLRAVAFLKTLLIRVSRGVVIVIPTSSVVPEAEGDGTIVCTQLCFSIEVVDFWGCVYSELAEANAASKLPDSFDVSLLIFRCLS